jgi:hypothetical protein
MTADITAVRSSPAQRGRGTMRSMVEGAQGRTSNVSDHPGAALRPLRHAPRATSPAVRARSGDPA